ncbi:MAG: HdeD family acid-resistance protein [Sphingobacteriales bacterium]
MEISVDRNWRHWWVFLVRGILFMLLGAYMFATPANSFAALAFAFGLIIFVAGVGELIRVMRENSAADRGWHLALGLFDLIIGVALIGHLAVGEDILRIVVGLWIIFRGITLLLSGNRPPRSWFLVAGGVVVAVFGLFVLIKPVFGGVTIVVWTAFALVVMGVMNILLSLRMKRLA